MQLGTLILKYHSMFDDPKTAKEGLKHTCGKERHWRQYISRPNPLPVTLIVGSLSMMYGYHLFAMSRHAFRCFIFWSSPVSFIMLHHFRVIVILVSLLVIVGRSTDGNVLFLLSFFCYAKFINFDYTWR